MRKSDKERLKKIVEIWSNLSAFMAEHNVTEENITNDTYLQWTVTTPIYNIGEQVFQMTNEIKNKYPDLPWRKVSGLRHRLVHEYEETDWEIISDILFHQMDDFVKSVEDILKTM